jgi:hypothetical protein
MDVALRRHAGHGRPKKRLAATQNQLKEAWFAVCTVPRYEKLVHARLMAKQIQSFYLSIRLCGNGE